MYNEIGKETFDIYEFKIGDNKIDIPRFIYLLCIIKKVISFLNEKKQGGTKKVDQKK